MIPPVDPIVAIQPSASNVGDDVDALRESQGRNQLTLETDVTIVTGVTPVEPQEQREGSVHSNFAKYRTSPFTFEDYFRKSRIQRLFVFKVLRFQFYLNFGAAFTSFLSTVISDQVWFWEGKDDLLHALLLHTVILSTMMLVIPFLTYKLQQWNPRVRSQSVLGPLLRVYQAALGTFWFSFGCGKIWRPKDLEMSSDSNLPLFFLPVTYFGLSTFNQLVIICFIRFTQIKISNRNAALISGSVSAGFLGLTLPLVLTGTMGRGFLLWEALQLAGGGAFSAIDSALSFISFKKSMEKTSKTGSEDLGDALES